MKHFNFTKLLLGGILLLSLSACNKEPADIAEMPADYDLKSAINELPAASNPPADKDISSAEEQEESTAEDDGNEKGNETTEIEFTEGNAGIICFSTTPLIEASKYNNLDELNRLLAEGADVNERKEGCANALMLATSPRIVRALLTAGADINAVDKIGNNALIFQIWYSSNPEIFNILLEAGIDINAKNKLGGTALMAAVSPDGGYYVDVNKEVLEQVLAAGADINASDNTGQTALMLAADLIGYDETRGSDLEDLINTLLDAGANVNACDKEGRTALMYALNAYKESQSARKKQDLPPNKRKEEDLLKEIQILIEAKADVNIKDNDGKTALKLAQEAGNEKIVELLKQAGAKE